MLAITTLVLVLAYWLGARKASLPHRADIANNALFPTAILQFVLGILTLMLAVPTMLAASHQAVAMLMFTVALYLVHSLRPGQVNIADELREQADA